VLAAYLRDFVHSLAPFCTVSVFCVYDIRAQMGTYLDLMIVICLLDEIIDLNVQTICGLGEDEVVVTHIGYSGESLDVLLKVLS
jgi:hypothetical protein